MKRWAIIANDGETIVGFIEAASVRFIARGIDFQPNIFNGYHAVEFDEGAPPAVLNLPLEMKIVEVEA